MKSILRKLRIRVKDKLIPAIHQALAAIFIFSVPADAGALRVV